MRCARWAKHLGLPAELVWRQPFPGPGLAVRCLGEVTAVRLETLREADAIFVEELTKARLLGKRATGGEERSHRLSRCCYRSVAWA